MARFCVSCGSQISDESNVCSKCGQPAYQAAGGGTVAAPSAGTAGLTDNIAGMLAYVTIIPAIVFLLLEPYNRIGSSASTPSNACSYGLRWW